MGPGGEASGQQLQDRDRGRSRDEPRKGRGSEPPETGVSECMCICPAKPRGFIVKATCSPLTYLMSMAIPVAQIGKLRLGGGGEGMLAQVTEVGRGRATT